MRHRASGSIWLHAFAECVAFPMSRGVAAAQPGSALCSIRSEQALWGQPAQGNHCLQ